MSGHVYVHYATLIIYMLLNTYLHMYMSIISHKGLQTQGYNVLTSHVPLCNVNQFKTQLTIVYIYKIVKGVLRLFAFC